MYSVRSLSEIERKQEMIKKYREEKRQEVIDARKDGATIAQIAVMTGVGQSGINWMELSLTGHFATSLPWAYCASWIFAPILVPALLI
jgi:hypothetical protein